jgi:hypothetical protein
VVEVEAAAVVGVEKAEAAAMEAAKAAVRAPEKEAPMRATRAPLTGRVPLHPRWAP